MKQYQSPPEPNDKGFDTGTIEEGDGSNAALEELKRSTESKKGSFMNKLAFWQTSNDKKIASTMENSKVGYLTFYSSLTLHFFKSNLHTNINIV